MFNLRIIATQYKILLSTWLRPKNFYAVQEWGGRHVRCLVLEHCVISAHHENSTLDVVVGRLIQRKSLEQIRLVSNFLRFTKFLNRNNTNRTQFLRTFYLPALVLVTSKRFATMSDITFAIVTGK